VNSLKSITLADVEWELICEPEQFTTPEEHLCTDEPEDDAKDCELIRQRLDSGDQWAWCSVRLVGRFRALECWDSLGSCNFESEDDFRQSGYFADMQLEVLRQLQEEASNIAEFFRY